jgi:hypothetical protein
MEKSLDGGGNMRMFYVCVIGAIILGLTGCEAKIKGPEVKIPEVTISTQGNGCPPGQAKKGRC